MLRAGRAGAGQNIYIASTSADALPLSTSTDSSGVPPTPRTNTATWHGTGKKPSYAFHRHAPPSSARCTDLFDLTGSAQGVDRDWLGGKKSEESVGVSLPNKNSSLA